jgi:hypothetical protein
MSSQLVAISMAVGAQLHADGNPSNNTEAKMQADYQYTAVAIGQFLQAVSNQIAAPPPPSYNFAYDQAFVTTALGLSVGGLIGAIDSKTVGA